MSPTMFIMLHIYALIQTDSTRGLVCVCGSQSMCSLKSRQFRLDMMGKIARMPSVIDHGSTQPSILWCQHMCLSPLCFLSFSRTNIFRLCLRYFCRSSVFSTFQGCVAESRVNWTLKIWDFESRRSWKIKQPKGKQDQKANLSVYMCLVKIHLKGSN